MVWSKTAFFRICAPRGIVVKYCLVGPERWPNVLYNSITRPTLFSRPGLLHWSSGPAWFGAEREGTLLNTSSTPQGGEGWRNLLVRIVRPNLSTLVVGGLAFFCFSGMGTEEISMDNQRLVSRTGYQVHTVVLSLSHLAPFPPCPPSPGGRGVHCGRGTRPVASWIEQYSVIYTVYPPPGIVSSMSGGSESGGAKGLNPGGGRDPPSLSPVEECKRVVWVNLFAVSGGSLFRRDRHGYCFQ
jgi:hypothetical protein